VDELAPEMARLVSQVAGAPRKPAAEGADGPSPAPRPDTLQILPGAPLEVNPKTGKAKGGIDPPAAAWTLVWTLRRAGVKLGIDTNDPNYININIRPAALVSAAQRELLELLSYDIWWLLGESPATPEDVAPPMPWPAEVLGLGPRRIGLFAPCARCRTGSWVRYSETTYCLLHARAAERDGQALAAEVRRQQEGGTP
jgi:hypothetical protein